jgi:hypothetical protein
MGKTIIKKEKKKERANQKKADQKYQKKVFYL